MLGPHTILQRPPKLEEINGKPTGQGFGAARKGPQVHGGPIEAVTDEKYSEGESFSTNLNEVSNIGVK